MNKFIISIFVLFIVVSFVGCNKKKTDDTTPQVEDKFDVETIKTTAEAYIWGAPDSVSIMQDVGVYNQSYYWGDDWLKDCNKLYADGIKGECASFQLMFTAKKDIGSFYATAKQLKTEGSQIDLKNIEVLAERYIEVKSPSSTSKKASMFSGWYPDALVPMVNYAQRKQNKVASGENQGVWVNVNIPTDAKAGTYKGTIELKLDGTAYDIPFEIYVYDLTISETIHAKTAIDYWDNQIGFYEEPTDENDNIIEWSQIYYDFLLSKRVTPQHIPNQIYGVTFAKNCIKYAQDPKVNGYRLPYQSTSKQFSTGKYSIVSYDSVVEQLSLMANENIKLRQSGDYTTNLFEKAYYYLASIVDEPSILKYEVVKYCDTLITAGKQEAAKLLADYPDLQASLLAIPHVVTTTYTDAIAGNQKDGGVQTFCTEVQRITNENLLKIRERKADTSLYDQGVGQWLYMTCTSNNPYPSFQLDDNLLGTRALRWMVYNYGVERILFWNTCYYSKYTGSETISRDVWNDPCSWETANGDGQLLYPGSSYGLLTPISTLRLESFRQGSEDYEYLWMLEQELNEYNETASTKIDVIEAINAVSKDVFKYGTVVPTTDVKKFANARTQLLELLVEFNTNEAKAIEKINNLLK